MLSKKKLLIFPTQRAIRNYLETKKSLNTLLPTCLTIDDFLKKSIYFENKIYCDEEQRILLLSEAIKDIDIKKLGISSSFTKFLTQSEYIYRFFLEISSEGIDINDIKTKDTYEFYKEHLEILGEILKNYKELLDKNLFVDRLNLKDNYKINLDYLELFEDITIYFEGYFTKQEFEIIIKISQAKDLKINFFSNIYNQKSLQVFKNIDFELKINHKYMINLSRKEIINELLSEEVNRNIEIKGFSSRLNQISYIKSSIANCVNLGINPNKIAVILPDESFAATLELFDKENYFNFSMGKSILNKNIYQKANGIYNFILENEQKNIENLKFLDLDFEFIEKEIKHFWNKPCKKEKFIQITDFLKNNEQNIDLLEKYDEMIYKLNFVLFSQNFDLRLKDIYKIFLQKLAKISLDDAHSGKITVMGLLETRLIDFDAIIICDFNNSFIPKISLKDKFLSTKVKYLANLPTKIDRENLQKYYYKRLIDSSKNIFISYVESKEEDISKFAYELFRDIKISSNDNEYKDILYNSRKLEYKDEEILLSIDLTKQSWSASGLKMFLECKRKWYLNYILKLKEHTLSKLPKSFELGNIVHSILEEYYKNENSNIDEIFLKYKSDNPFLILDLEIFKHNIKKLLDDDKNRLKTRQIVDIEKKFSISFNGFELIGVIDRVDKFEDSYELIDYKTSRSLKIDTINTYNKSCDFQLEFYFLAIKNLYESANIKAFYYDIFENSLKQEVVLNEKLELLRTIFDDLKIHSKDKINFCKTEDKTICTYCFYKTICNRD
ncbi:hypothetical protein AN286_01355 [Aliarcobacter cryaerophilus ATCC 43158]|uniref:AddAB recombination complex, helicase AddB n=1 Tax=Aliarcobacter cryaerophilus ATCC 43158 TaxID=1032070 RepID=A0AAD0TY78_9BACT|nr:PD-(D/E)XK nuclease family protein [Aliarcobacter cryaerophilus]AYJ80788.1 AddAB recombination complex, helicase AddB [Aliarcobacter cryaerophilus ATCC 43158]PRM98285.1 hypothetical protein CJ667_02290 [Aliarcobacter cryaerophilus]QCZ23116.1 hypothetical protein AN286_01355 [Aliarcobacter cryaerophilus ATCC 43158]